VIYQAATGEEILVIHAFQKKTQKTPQHEIEAARERLRGFLEV